MNLIFYRGIITGLAIALICSSCTPKATPTSVADVIGTTAAQLAVVMLTQTAGASSSTPPPPTFTPTPSFTETPAGTPTDKPVPKPPAVIMAASCWKGPGNTYPLSSNIELNERGRKKVTIIGIGSEPGWIVIRNPYFHDPCWIEISNLEIDPIMDMSQFPVMTPAP